MNPAPLYISRDDHTKLRLLLSSALNSSSNPSARAARQKLRGELDRATVLDPIAIPADVVVMESTVAFEDIATGEVESYTIAFPERADLERNRISVLAPIGTALIGARAGDRVTWPTPGGLRELRVLRVIPPDASPGSPAALATAAL